MYEDSLDFEERMIDFDFLNGGANEQEEDEQPLERDDCPMDGDAESALASCGWGMDEDYSHGNE
jgi:hypothetical protein